MHTIKRPITAGNSPLEDDAAAGDDEEQEEERSSFVGRLPQTRDLPLVPDCFYQNTHFQNDSPFFFLPSLSLFLLLIIFTLSNPKERDYIFPAGSTVRSGLCATTKVGLQHGSTVILCCVDFFTNLIPFEAILHHARHLFVPRKSGEGIFHCLQHPRKIIAVRRKLSDEKKSYFSLHDDDGTNHSSERATTTFSKKLTLTRFDSERGVLNLKLALPNFE